ncbi:MAG: hypothetical protein RR844_02910 [Clostridium sp.]
MNKKKIALLLAGIMAIASLTLVGCGKDDSADKGNGQTQEQEQQEGPKTYTYKKADKKGVTIVELTYENGEVSDLFIDYDYMHAGNSKRALCEKGEYVMKEGEEFNWAQQVDKLTDFIKENKYDLSKVGSSAETQTTDAVTGVSIKVNGYVETIKEAMDAVEAGKLTANEDLKTYKYEQEGEKGTTIVEITYAKDKPVDLFIDYLQDGKSKRELCAKGEYVMKEGEEFTWAQQADLLTAFIIENNFDLSKVGSSAETQTTDAVTGVSIKVNGYVTAVQEAMDKVADGSLK